MVDRTYQPTNREKSRMPRGRAFWCDGCDGTKRWAGERCWHCGARSGKTKRHKPKSWITRL